MNVQLSAEAAALLAEQLAELRAIEEALEGLERGEQGVPLDEAVLSLRSKYQLPAGR
jgi:hypothetical protein